MRTIPAGITWERHGRLRSTVAIRREPEIIYDWSDYAAQFCHCQNWGAPNYSPLSLFGGLYGNQWAGSAGQSLGGLGCRDT